MFGQVSAMQGDPIEDRTHFSSLHSSHSSSTRKVRPSQSAEFLLEVSTSIQPRDRLICLALYNNRVLTTHQVKEIFFENDRVCRRRLAKLKELGLVKPFRPRAAQGSYPNHHVLGDLGVYVVAAEIGVDVKDLGLRKDRMTKIAFSPKLRHTLAVNSFWSRLAWECRHVEGFELAYWRSELQVARKWFGEHWAIPDGEAAVRSGSGLTRLFLEMDMGTESPQRLQRKFFDYSELLGLSRDPPYGQHWLLFCLPDQAREASVRKAAAGYCHRIFMATTTFPRHLHDPFGLNWLPMGDEQRYALPYMPAIPQEKKPDYVPED